MTCKMFIGVLMWQKLVKSFFFFFFFCSHLG